MVEYFDFNCQISIWRQFCLVLEHSEASLVTHPELFRSNSGSFGKRLVSNLATVLQLDQRCRFRFSIPDSERWVCIVYNVNFTTWVRHCRPKSGNLFRPQTPTTLETRQDLDRSMIIVHTSTYLGKYFDANANWMDSYRRARLEMLKRASADFSRWMPNFVFLVNFYFLKEARIFLWSSQSSFLKFWNNETYEGLCIYSPDSMYRSVLLKLWSACVTVTQLGGFQFWNEIFETKIHSVCPQSSGIGRWRHPVAYLLIRADKVELWKLHSFLLVFKRKIMKRSRPFCSHFNCSTDFLLSQHCSALTKRSLVLPSLIVWSSNLKRKKEFSILRDLTHELVFTKSFCEGIRRRQWSSHRQW